MSRKLIILLTAVCSTIIFLSLNPLAESKSERPLVWKKYHEALAEAKAKKRHVMVNFTAKWCGYCRKMEATTFKDAGIVATLNEHFSIAQVDGDSYDLVNLAEGDITEKGLTRQFGVTGYPTTWLLEPDGNKIAPVSGYVDKTQLQMILDYIWTNSNDKMSFKEFVESSQLKAQGK